MKSTLLAISFGLLAIGGASAQTIVFSENFNSYNSGNLVGQGSWALSGSGAVQVGPGTGINETQTATKGTNTSTTLAFKNVTLGLGDYTSGTWQMDIMREASATGDYMAGLANATTNNEAFSFGLNGGTFRFREGVAGGDIFNLYSSSSTLFTTSGGSWFRLTANISFAGANATITGVTIQNLTTSGSALTAYFDSGATQTTLALASDETAWNRAWVRTGISTDTGAIYVDNLQFTAVPEPTTWALLAAGLTTVMVLRRRRQS